MLNLMHAQLDHLKGHLAADGPLLLVGEWIEKVVSASVGLQERKSSRFARRIIAAHPPHFCSGFDTSKAALKWRDKWRNILEIEP